MQNESSCDLVVTHTETTYHIIVAMIMPTAMQSINTTQSNSFRVLKKWSPITIPNPIDVAKQYDDAVSYLNVLTIQDVQSQGKDRACS